ncbi:hypothetical protein D4764_15G0009570 [Takifugu flavidus]|uniref:Uncharacterized protein n=1 Tax=Takifugu flavidus TaxID=433684 RepID=A0A5C6P1Z5_9TELE|nr:hypothetical protein D4764_15G0009570 [Takifugu flavidus]
MEQRFGLRRVTLTELLCAELQSHSDRGHHLQDILERGEQLPEVVECSKIGLGLILHPSIHPSIHPSSPPTAYRVMGAAAEEEKPRLPSPQLLLPAHPGGSPGVPRPVEIHSLSNVSWVFPGVSYRRDMP